MNTAAATATTTQDAPIDDTALAFEPLTGNDRCDRDSGEQAVAQVLVGETLLLFCGHHWREHEHELRDFPHSVPEREAKPMTWRRAQELGAPEQRDAGSAPE